MKTLVITDLHLSNKIAGLLNAQVECITKICADSQPDDIVIMGDVFMNRRPSPSELLGFKQILDFVSSHSSVTVLRGNHDSETKADDGITALSLYENSFTDVTIIKHTTEDSFTRRVYIPHYENQETIKKALDEVPEGYRVFGHFGYRGCLNSAGDADFSLRLSDFRTPSLLGHIHRHVQKDNVTILGTPYTTNFGECGNDNYYAIIDDGGPRTKKNTGWVNANGLTEVVEYKKVTHGPRHVLLKYKSIKDDPDLIEFLNDDNYFTLLRILRDREDEELLLEDINVASIDIKWNPSSDEVLEDSSSYSPSRDLFSINEVILEDYVNSVQTSLTKEQIMTGYSLLKHED